MLETASDPSAYQPYRCDAHGSAPSPEAPSLGQLARAAAVRPACGRPTSATASAFAHGVAVVATGDALDATVCTRARASSRRRRYTAMCPAIAATTKTVGSHTHGAREIHTFAGSVWKTRSGVGAESTAIVRTFTSS